MNEFLVRILSVTSSCIIPAVASLGLATRGTQPPPPPPTTPSTPSTISTASSALAGPRDGMQPSGAVHERAPDRPALSDRLVADAAGDELEADPRIDLSRLTVERTDDAVTIDGADDDLLSRHRTTRPARTVRDVREVGDLKLTVPASERTASEIAIDLECALLPSAATDPFETDVTGADDGRIVLDGEVSSARERKLAERIASSARGVTTIDDRLEPELDDIRTDAALRQEIGRALRWSVRLDHRDLTIRVRNGRVVLEGTVGSVAELERARGLARVLGVQAVDATGVAIVHGGRDREAGDVDPGDMEPRSDEDTPEPAARMPEHDPRADAEDAEDVGNEAPIENAREGGATSAVHRPAIADATG